LGTGNDYAWHTLGLPKELQVLPKTRTGDHVGVQGVGIARGEELLIRSDDPIQAHIDGELGRDYKFDICIVPSALIVMTPS